MSIRDLLLLLVTAWCCGMALRRPDIGMVSYIGYSLFGPHSFTWNLAKSFPHVQVIALCTFVGYLLSSERKRIPLQRETVIMALLWVTFGFSTLLAMSPERAIQPFVLISKILLMIFLSLSIINTEQRIHLLLRVLALSIGLHALRAGSFVLRTGGNSMVWGPVHTFLEANNSFGLALVMNLPFLYYLAKLESNVWLRWLMRVMLIMTYPTVVATFSRAAWIGLVVVTAIFMLKSKYKPLGVALLITASLAAPVVLPLLISQRMADRYGTLSNLDEDGSTQSRFWSWEFCKRVGVDRPLSGAGFHFYSLDAYAQYYPEFLERFPGQVWSCHSTWLSIFAEHGTLAFLLWVGLLWSCFASLGQVRHYAMRHEQMTNFVQWAELLRTALYAFAIVGTFVDFAYYEVFYQVVAIVILLKDQIRQRDQQPAVKTAAVKAREEARRFAAEPERQRAGQEWRPT